MTQLDDGVAQAGGIAASPGHNFGSDCEITTLFLTRERNLARAPLSDAVRTSAGSAALGLLVLMVDIAGSYPALASCRPDWTATQDLALHATGWVTEGPVVADMRMVRVGKKVIVVEGDVYDAHGLDDFEEIRAEIDGAGDGSGTGRLTPAARSLVTFVRLPGTAANSVGDFNPADWVGEVRELRPNRRPEGTMRSRAGLQIVDPAGGVVEVAHTPYVVNGIGTIGGAVQALAIEAAAEAMRPGLVATEPPTCRSTSSRRCGPARPGRGARWSATPPTTPWCASSSSTRVPATASARWRR